MRGRGGCGVVRGRDFDTSSNFEDGGTFTTEKLIYHGNYDAATSGQGSANNLTHLYVSIF